MKYTLWGATQGHRLRHKIVILKMLFKEAWWNGRVWPVAKDYEAVRGDFDIAVRKLLASLSQRP